MLTHTYPLFVPFFSSYRLWMMQQNLLRRRVMKRMTASSSTPPIQWVRTGRQQGPLPFSRSNHKANCSPSFLLWPNIQAPRKPCSSPPSSAPFIKPSTPTGSSAHKPNANGYTWISSPRSTSPAATFLPKSNMLTHPSLLTPRGKLASCSCPTAPAAEKLRHLCGPRPVRPLQTCKRS